TMPKTKTTSRLSLKRLERLAERSSMMSRNGKRGQRKTNDQDNNTKIISPGSFLAVLAPRGRPDERNCAGATAPWPSPTATHPAPRVTPAVATPATAPVRAPSTPAGSPTRARRNPAAAPTRAPPRTPAGTTAEPSPAVTPAASSPLHVRHVIDRNGGGHGQRERGGRSGR